MPLPPLVAPVAALPADERERTQRHAVLRGFGEESQRRLAAAHVAIVGAGGLGSPAVLALAAAGVGILTVIDDDAVDLPNLQRQVLHRLADVGAPKVDSAVRAAAELSPHTVVRAVRERLYAGNADALLSGADLVIDGSDTFATRAVVVAGPARSDVAGAVTWVREDPPFTGPAAAIVAALAALPEQPARPDAPGPAWTLLLACDLADPAAAVAALTGARAAASADLDGWCLGDRDGRAQWLTALYRTAALRRAAAALPDAGTHASVRTLVGPLRLELIAAGPATDDIDTWHDAERAGARPRPVPTALLTPTKETP